MGWARVVSWLGLVLTAATLAVVVVTKFTHGAWFTLLLVAVLVAGMMGVRRHYRAVDQALDLDPGDSAALALPSRVHAIVLVSSMTRSTARAIAYARSTRPSTLEALTVAIDPSRLRRLRQEWEAIALPITLRILDAPSREITRPLIDYITELRQTSPRDLVVLYLPEKVVGHWWERYLHNRSAARLTARLRHVPGVVIASVPWQLGATG
jgi:hypothetical protein